MFPDPLFRSRFEAGRILAEQLRPLVADRNPLILALPRGGVPVGFEVAQALNADLDVFLVRKLGVPGHEELAMGAVASGGIRVLNEGIIADLGISDIAIDHAIQRELREIARRETLYRDGRPALDPANRNVVLVDDGLATGASMLAAVQALRPRRPARLVVAVPVAAPEACRQFREIVDAVVCAATPEPFLAVGVWYKDFAQTSDAEVRELLERAAHRQVA